mmetsp:Transcript_16491/g.19062  ORF Transcript_16491/g.19062 Transcript_16491/m.19062 type:complete len:82 (-) Transcript_16491:150-395(-)
MNYNASENVSGPWGLNSRDAFNVFQPVIPAPFPSQAADTIFLPTSRREIKARQLADIFGRTGEAGCVGLANVEEFVMAYCT